ncbi:putative adenosine deaminase, partial [Microsporum audouinii]
FPDGGTTRFRDWLKGRCTIEKDVSLSHHHGCAAIWEILEQKFQVVDAILYYEPIFRACLKRMLTELNEDGIRYVEFRLAFGFVYRRDRCEEPEPNFESMFEAFGEEIESFKASEAGQGFHGARMIWATMRSHTNRDIVESMKECIITKLQFPELICGFDLLGREDDGRPLVDMIPVLFWFKKQCAVEGVEIPFMFHAGECLGDGDETDSNLYDAILLGTRRIGHAFSLYKHPLLIDLVKEKKIMIECCPISNEVLRFTSSILSHPLPALLSRGVAVSLCNDDPAVLGHGRNGLTHDFCQVLNALENVGLSGLATMAENSLRWSCFEDQNNAAWLTGVKQGIAGTGRKTEYIRNWHIEFEKFCRWVILEFGSEAPESDGI